MSMHWKGIAIVGATALTALAPSDAAAQRARRSQRGTVSQTVNRTEITLVYDRPVARGRTLFGGLVDWGKIWTPGANKATEIEFTGDVLIDGRELPAGRYSVWVVPAEGDQWEWIFNKGTDARHTQYPGTDADALRVPLTVTTGSHMEVLAFYFPEVSANAATLNFHWGTTIVQIPIELDENR